MDVNKTGYVTRAEFLLLIKNLAEQLPIESIRVLEQFMDTDGTGKISVFAFSRLVLDILNSHIGGGTFAIMQVKPLIEKIINELSVDCDRFFDDVADLNQAWMDKKAREDVKSFDALDNKFKQTGLLKTIFVNTLNKYGVSLNERENALISSVFGLSKEHRDKLDYLKLDNEFEGA